MSIETNDIRRGEHNTAGCYRLHMVDVDDVDTIPDEVMGNVPGDIVLHGGKVLTTIKPSTFEMGLVEDSSYENGSPRVDLVIEWPIPKDRLSLLPILHGFHRLRVVAVVETLNPDPDELSDLTRLLVGNKEEPAVAYLIKRKTGADPRTDRSDYLLQLKWTRSTPTPFYNGTPPDLMVPTECPTLAEQLVDVDGDVAFGLLNYEQQQAAVNSITMALLWLYLTAPHQDQLLTAAGATPIADMDGASIWALLDPTQQADLLAAAGVTTLDEVNDAEPYGSYQINDV